MFQRTEYKCYLAREEDKEAGEKMLALWERIDELYREARINRKLLKVKMGKLKKLRKEYPNVLLCTDYMEHDDFYSY